MAVSLRHIIMDRGAHVRVWLHNWSRSAAQIMWLVVPSIMVLQLLKVDFMLHAAIRW